jgi:hypothetical protein
MMIFHLLRELKLVHFQSSKVRVGLDLEPEPEPELDPSLCGQRD